jgi:integrase
MTIKKVEKKWLVDVYPHGREGKRVRKKFDTRLEAQRYEKYVLNKSFDDKDWNPSKEDNRKLSELINIWFESHGRYLKGASQRVRTLRNLDRRLGSPVAKKVSPTNYMLERSNRIESGVTPKTCNNELGYLNAVFNELERTQTIEYNNPLTGVRPIKISEKELSWLTSEQIHELLSTIDKIGNEHVSLITRVCLSTGARWGEAQRLTVKNIRNGQVDFTDTKSGKNRSIPINESLFKQLEEHMRTHGRFFDCIKSFRKYLKTTSIKLPQGQSSHVLRHSFASHFMMNGGNILTLQKILGHSTIIMTMRYAHLAPEHLQEALIFNPLYNDNINEGRK